MKANHNDIQQLALVSPVVYDREFKELFQK